MDYSSFPDILSDRWLIIVVAFMAVAIAGGVPMFIDRVRFSTIPLVGKDIGDSVKRRDEYLTGARKLYTEGCQKFKDGAFRITTLRASPTVVLSPKYLTELKNLPDETLSVSAAIAESMEAKYTLLKTEVPVVPHTIKARLTPSLPRLSAVLQQEARDALASELPQTLEWQEIDIHSVLLRVVAMVSGRAFVGPTLCRNETYLDYAINYTTDIMAAQGAVSLVRPWLRPLLANRLPEVKRLRQRIVDAEAFMQPVVEQRRRIAADPAVDKPDDMLQWLIDGGSKFPDEVNQDVAKSQLGLSFAAIHTTTLSATNAFYNLVASPEAVPELREEAQKALETNDGVFTSKALQSMEKLDSFLKETMRMHPLTMATFMRKVLKPLTLSDGLNIPAGVTIEIPTVGIVSDPDIVPDAGQFDPWRYCNLREKARQEGSIQGAAQHQLASVTQDNLTFGYGRHACPGRFFAANEIKIIVANALLTYDFKMTDGASSRYPNHEFASMILPDFSKKLLCKIA